MKITLSNFRCHRDKIIEIPESGLVRLSGKSGAGKSTTFKSILYALYGNVKKPYSHGANTCSVTLEMKDLKITRSSRPNRLLLTYDGTTYEDDAAQGMINGYLGMSPEEFLASSYVVQRSLKNSVISMTPAEQVKFVETLAFNDYSHLIYRNDIKEKVKECRNNLLTLEGRLSGIEDRKEEKEKLLPRKPSSLDQDPNEVKEEYEKLSSFITRHKNYIPKLEKEIKSLEKVDEKNKSLRENIKKQKIELDHYLKLRANVENVMTDEEVSELEEKLRILHEEMKNLKNYEKYLQHSEEYERMKKSHQKRIDNLKSKLESAEDPTQLKKKLENLKRQKKTFEEREKLEDEKISALKIVKTVIFEIKEDYHVQTQRLKKYDSFLKFASAQLESDITKKNSLEDEIQVLESDEIRDDIYNKTYVCPECLTQVHLENENLTKGKARKPKEKSDLSDLYMKRLVYEARIEKLENWCQNLEEYIPSARKKLPPKIDYSPEIVDQVKTDLMVHDHIAEEDSEFEDSDIKIYIEEAKFLLPKKYKPKYSIDNLGQKISETEKKVEEAWRIKSEYSSLTREITTREKNIKSSESRLTDKRFLPSKDGRKLEDVKLELQECNQELLRISERVMELSETMEVINKLDSYQKDVEEIEELDREVKKLKGKVKEAQDDLQGAIGLEEAAKEAEIIAMESTIESINEHARDYLEEMFDEPISVRLESHKLTAKNIKKAQINTSVNYKGEQYVSIDELSGGEKQRCELAFLLAVNDMLGSNIILLDECLNNLNSEMNLEVLTHLRELGGDKLIIVISHEAIDGVFDGTVDL